ncbi:uncharacterized protein JN550_006025 [Neoarthrinium moseri]|uniref:uncharacterized protein n=1 Tax=Neoarthrinium moseri TaxID=1658444 RepID=UPI001FDC9EBD|nr:uncharacterized protein JN550_006025 [Neoarthrinium moseri]KAI1869038.1 hypothetical protein JN550_006025 [Neoarthrinium moseri]
MTTQMVSLSDPDKRQYHARVSSNTSKPPGRQWTTSFLISITVLAALLQLHRAFLTVTSSVSPLGTSEEKTAVWDWAALEPSKELVWERCYGGQFDCARLDVPLDWLEPSEEARVVLAVIRAPAKSREDYRGPGPGGSGVAWLAEGIADYLQTIIGDNHDIISWDPRGVGASVPRIDCWGSSRKRHDWAMQNTGVVDSHPGMLFDALAQFDAVSKQCESYMNTTTPGLLHHISTASHARDMLEISDKLGFEKVKYWGVSYGTILGGTFAALYPDRVERLVSDGNVDYGDWFANVQLNYLQDADKIMEYFFESCAKAGPEKCAFHEASAASIEERFFKLLGSLKKSPVLIPPYTNGTQLEMPELVTYSKLQSLLRGCLYKPIEKLPQLAAVMAALERKDGVPYYQMANEDDGPPMLDFCAVNETLPTVPEIPRHSDDAFPAIMCADGEPIDASPDSILAYAKALQRISRYAGASNVHSKLSCAGRRARPRWRFAGPFGGIQTSFPVLFVGNIADNVTPLRSARSNAAAFPGAVVLVQESYGHCSLAAPSTCTARAIRDYFQHGVLPDPDTRCAQDYEMFEEPPEISATGLEGDIARAVRELSRRAHVAMW